MYMHFVHWSLKEGKGSLAGGILGRGWGTKIRGERAPPLLYITTSWIPF